MALDPVGGDLGLGTVRNADGTCTTTVTVFKVWTDGVLIQSASNDVRYRCYAKNETAPATGDSATGIKYIELDAGDSAGPELVRNPQGGVLPWRLAIWGAAGGETVRIQAIS